MQYDSARENLAEIYDDDNNVSSGFSGRHHSRKLLALIFLLGLVFIVFSLLFVVLALKHQKETGNGVSPTPFIRPTATPIVEPTFIRELTPTLVQIQPSETPFPATPTPVVYITPASKDTGRLVFIKSGEIYTSDFKQYSLYIKSLRPAGDSIAWSRDGEYLAWREAGGAERPKTIAVHRTKDGRMSFYPDRAEAGEVFEFCFMESENYILISLKNGDSYNIEKFDLSADNPDRNGVILTSSDPIRDLVCLANDRVIFRNQNSIRIVPAFGKRAEQDVVKDPKITRMIVNPEGNKLVYFTGDIKGSDAYVVDLENYKTAKLDRRPANILQDRMRIEAGVLDKGFLPYAAWLPKSGKLLVAYGYLPDISLIGLYDTDDKSFEPVSNMRLGLDDLMLDELRLAGLRVNTVSAGKSEWQLVIFTLEDMSNLGIIRIIPQVSSFDFFWGA